MVIQIKRITIHQELWPLLLTTLGEEKKQSLAVDDEDTLCDNEEAWLESVDTNEHRLNSEKRKKKRMSSYELSEIVVAKRIKTRTELLALAREQKLEGKTDIAEFIINRGPKDVADILESAWEMEDAQKTLERQRKSRLQLYKRPDWKNVSRTVTVIG